MHTECKSIESRLKSPIQNPTRAAESSGTAPWSEFARGLQQGAHLINGAGNEAADALVLAKHVREDGAEGRRRLDRGKGNLAYAVLVCESKRLFCPIEVHLQFVSVYELWSCMALKRAQHLGTDDC
jgi:hypothetical protein